MQQYNFSPDVRRLNPELVGSCPQQSDNSKPSKFHNVRSDAKGMTFSSGHEADVVNKLILAEEQKAIFALRLQVRFPLPGGVFYVADAVYLDERLKPHIVDAKGMKTDVYKLKRKQFKERYGQDIEEV